MSRNWGCQFSRADRHGEAFGNCPFHRSKSGKSFKVNIQTGLWYCHGCGFGGDVYTFVERRYSLSYLDAAKYLGTLEDGPPVEVATVQVPYLTLDFDIDGGLYRESVRDEPRDYREKIRRFFCDARDQLAELKRMESSKEEQEVCWERMALALDELREMEIL